MKRTTVLNLSKFKFFAELRTNPSLFSFFALFLISLICGCLFYRNGHFEKLSSILFDFFYSNSTHNKFSLNLIFTFVVYFSFLFASYLFGTSVIGIAFIPAIVFVKGIFTSLLLCHIYANFGFQGIVYNLLMFIPGTLISILVLFTGCSECIKLSYNLGSMLFGGSNCFEKNFRKRFVVLFLILTLLLVIASMINVLSSRAFINYFTLG